MAQGSTLYQDAVNSVYYASPAIILAYHLISSTLLSQKHDKLQQGVSKQRVIETYSTTISTLKIGILCVIASYLIDGVLIAAHCLMHRGWWTQDAFAVGQIFAIPGY